MFDNTPNNLPTEGKSLLDTMSPPSAPPVGPAAKMENLPKNNFVPPAPQNSPKPPSAADDMFAEVKDIPAAPAKVASKMDVAQEKENTVVETPHQGFKKVLITIGSIVVFTAALAAGGYWAYNQFLKPQPLNPNLNLNLNINTSANTQTQQEQQVETPPITEPVIVDSDNDGLTNTEEGTAGSDPLNPDTDGDRLFDGEEVNVYHTDPLNKDTDGDTFEDGSEVQNGYDPKGPGKLIKIPA
ncbi:MAG: hypothetical protein WC459_00045 [Patescibacteria group bacterium]